MESTIIITGANGSLAIPAVEYVLQHLPNVMLVLTVRDATDADAHTKALRDAVAKFPGARVSIRALDLGHLQVVRDFAGHIADEIAQAKLPKLSSIISTAYYWNLVGPMELSGDGYEKTFQVTYLAHFSLVLRLLGSFQATGGRVVLFTSDGYEPGKNNLEKIPPSIPSDAANLDLLVKPCPDNASIGALGHGFHRYANSKLALVMFTHALNRRLRQDVQLANITVVVTNPGNLADSRALTVNTPRKLVILSKFVLRPLRPLLSFADPTARTAAEAGRDAARLATGEANPGERGYFTLLKPEPGSKDSQDEAAQEALWAKSLQWVGLEAKDTRLSQLR